MGGHSKDEVNAPSWVNKQFFEDILKFFHNTQKVFVYEFNIKPGTSAGDHFASVLFKVLISYKIDNGPDEELHTVMKLLPSEDGYKKEVLKEQPSFTNEIRMYSKILPEMERVLIGAGIKTVFGPKLIYSNLTSHPSPVVILKDVSPDGFSSENFGTLGMGKITTAAKAIAKFHAASMYLNETGGTILTDFQEHVFTPKEPGVINPVDEFVRPPYTQVVNNLKNCKGYEELGNLLDQNKENYFKQFQQAYASADKASVCVLNHGDYHGKNIMFRNEGLDQEDFLMIDFQCPIWGSPVIDLYFLFNLTATPDIRENRRDEIISIYHTELAETLRKLGYRKKIPTLLDIQIDLLQFSILDLIQIVSFTQMQFLSPEQFDFGLFAEDPGRAMKEMSEIAFEMEEFREYLIRNLKRLQSQGTLSIV